MPEEIELLLSRTSHVLTERRGMRDYSRGTLCGREVTLVFSRCGKVAAASTVTTLVETYGVDLVVFTGVAGGLDPDLRIGDVVVGSSLVQHDVDASPVLGFRRFEIPLLGVAEFWSPPRLVEAAAAAGTSYLQSRLHAEVPGEELAEFGILEPRLRRGLIVSGDTFLAGGEAVDRLREILSGALCVEMEGAAVGQVCFEHEVPLIVIRAISDRADHAAAVDFPRFIRVVARYMTAGIVEELLKTL